MRVKEVVSAVEWRGASAVEKVVEAEEVESNAADAGVVADVFKIGAADVVAADVVMVQAEVDAE